MMGAGGWWLAIGVVASLGLLTRYTIGVLLAGLALGVVATSGWRWFTQRWLWAGAALALMMWLPNLVWQAQHGFVSLAFLKAIHARDVSIGRTQGYLPEQLFVSTTPMTVPLWILGPWFYLFSPARRHYGLLGWMYIVPFVLLLIVQGWSHYLGPAYPVLMAAGSVVVKRWLTTHRASLARAG